MFLKKILNKLGISIGRHIFERNGEVFVKFVPFVPKTVFVDYDILGPSCSGFDAKICVEKSINHFVIKVDGQFTEVQLTWIALAY